MVEDYEVVTYTNVICYSDSKQGICTYFIMLTALMFFAWSRIYIELGISVEDLMYIVHTN
jgi:hypothetical protein